MNERESLIALLKVMDENIAAADKLNDEGINHLYEAGLDIPATALDPAPYRDDFFVKHVPEQKEKDGSLSLFLDHYEPYEMFLYDEIDVEENTYREKSHIGYFKESFPFLALKEDGRIWMSLTPHEINTMKEPIEMAKGHVLALGLGLGYYAAMVAQKETVKSVTVIEKNQKIIDLFNRFIRPHLPSNDKIRIVQDDALRYVRSSADAYDEVFADLWHQPLDGLIPYIRLKHLERNDVHYTYWVERSLLCLLRRAILITLDEIAHGATANQFAASSCDSDRIINAVYHAIKKSGEPKSLRDEDIRFFAKRLLIAPINKNR